MGKGNKAPDDVVADDSASEDAAELTEGSSACELELELSCDDGEAALSGLLLSVFFF